MRSELGVELAERDYAKTALSIDELRALFAGHDPRLYLNPKSPAYKAGGLAKRALTPEQALELMARDPQLIKRPLTRVGKQLIAGFDREGLRAALS